MPVLKGTWVTQFFSKLGEERRTKRINISAHYSISWEFTTVKITRWEESYYYSSRHLLLWLLLFSSYPLRCFLFSSHLFPISALGFVRPGSISLSVSPLDYGSWTPWWLWMTWTNSMNCVCLFHLLAGFLAAVEWVNWIFYLRDQSFGEWGELKAFLPLCCRASENEKLVWLQSFVSLSQRTTYLEQCNVAVRFSNPEMKWFSSIALFIPRVTVVNNTDSSAQEFGRRVLFGGFRQHPTREDFEFPPITVTVVSFICLNS